MTSALRKSEAVPLGGITRVEKPNTGKEVASVTLRLEERPGPTPARRLISIETGDGAVYRFQRHGTNEPLAFYNRQNPDGSTFSRNAPLPAHVEAVKEGVEDGTVRPGLSAWIAAHRNIGSFETRIEAARQAAQAGLTPDSASRLSPDGVSYATDGGHPNRGGRD